MDASNLSLPGGRDIPLLFNRMAGYVKELDSVLSFIGERYNLLFDCDETKASFLKVSATGNGDDRPLAEIEKGEYGLWRVTRFDADSRAPSVNSFTGSQTYEILQEELAGAFEARAIDILPAQRLDMPLQTFSRAVLGAVINNPASRMKADIQRSLDLINRKLRDVRAPFHFEQIQTDKKILVFKIESSIEFDELATIFPASNNYYNFTAPQIGDDDTPAAPQIRDATDIIIMLENKLEAYVDPETKRRIGAVFSRKPLKALPPPS